MLISQIHIPGTEGSRNILVGKGKIEGIFTGPVSGEFPVIQFEQALAFPGLINSHDHLEFNLYPQLGNQIYNNYREWGEDIYAKNVVEINAIQKIPASLRAKWGLYKNLINGFTTVVDHGTKSVFSDPVIHIFNHCHSLHSLHYEKKWKWKLNDPFAGCQPLVIHLGEGIDAASFQEIDQLIKWNLLKKPLIAVHGVAMQPKQAGAFKALVWCPASNYFLLGATADIAGLKDRTKIVFGTDSTLSAGWNAWEHLRIARQQKGLTNSELFAALTSTAAGVWKMNDRGIIGEGKIADIVVARAGGQGFDGFFALNPADILLVMVSGEIQLFDNSLLGQLNHIDLRNYCKIRVCGEYKFVKGELPALANEIRKYYPSLSFPVEICS